MTGKGRGRLIGLNVVNKTENEQKKDLKRERTGRGRGQLIGPEGGEDD